MHKHDDEQQDPEQASHLGDWHDEDCVENNDHNADTLPGHETVVSHSEKVPDSVLKKIAAEAKKTKK